MPKGGSTARSAELRSLRAITYKKLAPIALESWKWAEGMIEPTRVVTRNGRVDRVLGVEQDVGQPRSAREGRQAIKLLLEGKRPRGSKGDHTRHWAIWRMMNRLLEWSEFNDARDRVLFPYPTPHAAAAGVVEGFHHAGLDSSLTLERVLNHYRRHFAVR
jgi:hypothetical protein